MILESQILVEKRQADFILEQTQFQKEQVKRTLELIASIALLHAKLDRIEANTVIARNKVDSNTTKAQGRMLN